MLIHIKIQPESKEDKVIMKSDNSYIVYVREKAERNQANIKMRSLLATHFKVDLGKVKIITGHHAPSKIIDIIE
ncbi:MAG: DUF167 domain-containing protein [Patescibacteria group bacterium]